MAKDKEKKAKVKAKENKKPVEKKVKKEGLIKGIRSEFKKVRWPSKKEMIKYSIATIVFVLFFGIFFGLIEVMMWAISRLVG